MFKLNIECTKDISELHINFTDGTSAVLEGPKEKVSPLSKSPKPKKERVEEHEVPEERSFGDPRFKDYDYEEPVPVPRERVKLPEIPDVKREVKVAEELHNLDF